MSKIVYQYVWSIFDGYHTVYRIDVENDKPPLAVAKLYAPDDSDDAHFTVSRFFVRVNQCDLGEGKELFEENGNIAYQFIWASGWEFVFIYAIDLDSKIAPTLLGKLYYFDEVSYCDKDVINDEGDMHNHFVKYIDDQRNLFNFRIH